MKKFLKFTLVFCCLVSMLSISTFAASSDFEIDPKTGVLIKYNGSASAVIIPNSVTAIGDWAFAGNLTMKSLVVPNSVKIIDEYAFRDCANLKTINIPTSVTSIGESAFENSGVTSITIPSSVKKIGKRAFFNSPLKTATISSTEIGFLAFEGCIDLENLTLTDSVKTIVAGAFQGCYNLKTLTIPKSIQTIGDAVFSNCGFSTIIIPNTVTEIGQAAFDRCPLVKINIPSSVEKIGANPFSNCTLLKEITVDSSNKNYIAAEGVLFTKDKTTLISYPAGKVNTSYTIPNTVKTIGQESFVKSVNLETVTIPNSVITINLGAFENCTGLTGLTLPHSVTSVGYNAFKGCTGLTSLILSNSITSIEGYAFLNCTGLKNIVIPSSVKDLGNEIFKGCTGIESVTINNSILGSRMFKDCTSLKNITLSSSVTSIGGGAFDGCIGLTNVILPKSITNINRNSFDFCFGLKSVTILNPAVVIENGALLQCGNATFYGEAGSSVEKYAKEKGLPFKTGVAPLTTSGESAIEQIVQNNGGIRLEAENATIGGAGIVYGSSLASKGRVVSNSSDERIKFSGEAFSVTFKKAPAAKGFILGYSSSNFDGYGVLKLYINGVYNQKIKVQNTKAWSDYKESQYIAVDIPKDATIELKVNGGGTTANIDCIDFYSKEPSTSLNIINSTAPVGKFRVEAESGSFTGNVKIKELTLASSGKIVSDLRTLKNAVEFKKVPLAYGLTIKYSSSDFNLGNLSLYINNVYMQDIIFPRTRSWSEYQELDLPINVPEGANIKFVVEAKESDVNLDYIDLDITDPSLLPISSKFEGEEGKLSGNIKIENLDGASGGKITSYFQYVGDSIEFKRASAAKKMTISYTRGNEDSGKLGLIVNGVRKQEIVFPNTGGWDKLGTVNVNVDIPEGATITFAIESSNVAVNMDCIQLSK
ncbi:leucine-rich repeat protein [Fusibacter sp. 3D3]|uniref:leucine-rich repeat protein n=1 Tax=Fusibacter sp. 3D3 TaxID=1048380 RepID=UPI000853CEB1|nr:leucine-rich repeat protein [Fusibacter sp. 3D3]GAU78840.1 chitin binding protein [Fusibacter sp. 3D3]